MEISEASVLEVWNLFNDFVPPAKRNDFAVKYLKVFLDDIEISELENLRGEDEHLDYALDDLSDPDLDEEEEYDDD